MSKYTPLIDHNFKPIFYVETAMFTRFDIIEVLDGQHSFYFVDGLKAFVDGTVWLECMSGESTGQRVQVKNLPRKPQEELVIAELPLNKEEWRALLKNGPDNVLRCGIDSDYLN